MAKAKQNTAFQSFDNATARLGSELNATERSQKEPPWQSSSFFSAKREKPKRSGSLVWLALING